MKTALVIADMHVGSAFGPFPVNFQASDGSVHALNIGQRYLWDCWQHMVRRLPPLHLLILNGDIIDGCQAAVEGRYLCEPDPQWQIRAARQLLQPILDHLLPEAQVYCTMGTDYHEGVAAACAEQLAEWCGAEKGPDGYYARDWLRLEVDGVVLDIAHRIALFSRYRSVPLERELGYAAEEADWMRGVDCIVRSHDHHFRYIQSGLRTAVATPAWQLQSVYARRSSMPNRLISQWIGSIVLNIDRAWREANMPPVQVVPLLYEHPVPYGERYGDKA